MRLFPILMREDGANDGAGGDGQPVQTVEPQPILTADELKQFGIENKDALLSFLKERQTNSVSDEEKRRQQEVEKANFLKYSVDNNLLTLEDNSKYETLSSRQAKDLVYESFLEAFKEDNPDIDPEEFEQEAKNAFESEYKLNSSNEKVKARGEARLAKEAKELITPYESKVKAAKENYTEFTQMAAKMPDYDKFITALVDQNTPEEIVAFETKEGEEDVKIPVKLSKEDKAELLKAFKTPKTFHAYTTGKPEEISKSISEKMQGYINKKYDKQIKQAIYDAAKGIGVKNGSNVGATNPYALQKGAASTATVITMEQSNDKIADARRRIKGR